MSTTFPICGGAWTVLAMAEPGTDTGASLAFFNGTTADYDAMLYMIDVSAAVPQGEITGERIEQVLRDTFATPYLPGTMDICYLHGELKRSNPDAYRDWIAPLYVTPDGRTQGDA